MKNKSFTLIELLVVIVIIGVLAGVIMVTTSSSVSNATLARAKAFSSNVQNSMLLNLVSEWTFDEPEKTGRITEDSWGVNDGTLHGSPVYQNSSSGNCVFGGCYSFNSATYDYISYSSPGFLATQSKTISAWFKLGADGYDNAASQPLVNVDYFRLYVRTTLNQIRARYDYPTSCIAPGYNLGSDDRKWHYVVGVYYKENSLNYVKLYVDGSLVNTASNENDPTNSYPGESGMGRITSGYFNGLIDDVRIYDATLSSSQIKQNYVLGLNSLLSNGNISKEEYNERINTLAYEK